MECEQKEQGKDIVEVQTQIKGLFEIVKKQTESIEGLKEVTIENKVKDDIVKSHSKNNLLIRGQAITIGIFFIGVILKYFKVF